MFTHCSAPAFAALLTLAGCGGHRTPTSGSTGNAGASAATSTSTSGGGGLGGTGGAGTAGSGTAGGGSGGSGTGGAGTLAAPTSLAVVYASATRLHLTWANDPPASTGTEIERATAAAGPFTALAKTAPAGATSFDDDDGIALSTQYYYRVRALDGSTVSGASNVATIAPPPIPAPCPAPGSITTTVLSDQSIKVDWTHSGVDVKGFRVEEHMNFTGYDYVLVADLPASARSYTDLCLRPGTPYVYRVTAYNEASTTSITTPTNTTTLPPAAAPAASSGPSNLHATQLTATSYRIEWTNHCSTADRILVEVSLPPFTSFASVLGGTCTGAASDTGCFLSDATYFSYVDLPVGSSYEFRARAGNSLGFSANSNVIVVNGPAAPPPPTGGSIGVFADYDNTKTLTDLLPQVNATVYPTGQLSVGCFWSYNVVLGIQDFICSSAAIHFPLKGTTTSNAAFDLTGKTIDKATFVLSVASPPVDPTNYSVSAISSPWSTNTLSGNTSLMLYAGGSTEQGSPTSFGPYAFDVTAIVQSWANGSYQNDGLLVEDAEYVFPDGDFIRTSFFYSTDSFNGYSQNRPTLWVDYH
jgi:hypothetical protein